MTEREGQCPFYQESQRCSFQGPPARHLQTYTTSFIIHTDDRLRSSRPVLFGTLVVVPFVLTTDGLTAFLERFVVFHPLVGRLGLDIVPVSLDRVVICLPARPTGSRIIL